MSQEWNVSSQEQPTEQGGETSGEAYRDGSKRKINGSTIALAAAFVAALVVLYLMGLQGKPRAATAEQVNHDQEVTRMIQEMVGKQEDAEKMRKSLSETEALVTSMKKYFEVAKSTVKLSENPFQTEEKRVEEPKPTGSAPVVVDPSREDAAMRALALEFSQLKLQSVFFMSKSSTALINGTSVGEGDRLGSFTVAKIESDRVILQAGNSQFELKAGNSQDKH